MFSYNGDTGIQLGFGHDFSDSHPGISSNDGSYCAYNLVVDCDSYQNYDFDNYGSDADGFACKMHNGLQNWFLRCRAWNNSDDAWDLFETDFPVYIIECWGWHSGDASQHPVSGGSFQGNGNGIKMGGNGTGGSSEGKHEAWNCVAFNNIKTSSVKGFDQNSHKGGVKLANCLAFNNGYDFMFEDSPSGTTNDFYNNVCLSNRIEINSTSAIMQNNVAINNPEKGWVNALNLSFSAADFNDLSEDAAKQSRGEDGSLPSDFARLIFGSELIDRGLAQPVVPLPSFVDQPLVGSAMQLSQPIRGSGRDLGPYESEYSNPTSLFSTTKTNSLLNGYSKNNQLVISFKNTKVSGDAIVKVFNKIGQRVYSMPVVMTDSGENIFILENFIADSGIYFVLLETKSGILSCKILVK